MGAKRPTTKTEQGQPQRAMDCNELARLRTFLRNEKACQGASATAGNSVALQDTAHGCSSLAAIWEELEGQGQLKKLGDEEVWQN